MGRSEGYLKQSRPLVSSGYFSLWLAIAIAVVLTGYYAYIIKPYVSIPADILMWSETSFVGDIIKLRIGEPIYTNPEYSNSLVYTPGPQILTYAIAWLIGKPTSIVAWRVIQFGFIIAAVLVAVSSCYLLSRIIHPEARTPYLRTWLILTFFILFLAATAPRVNKFVHCLHADALALLVSMVSFWTMLYYLRSPSAKRIMLMALCPALGFLTKQFLISWGAVMFIFLCLQSPVRFRRIALFATAACVFLGAAVGLCYLVWGDNFIFWAFKVMGGERKRIVFSAAGFNISLLRSFEHLVRAWMELSLGLLGGWLMVRADKKNVRVFGPLWVSWIVLVGFEATSSGSGWGVLYHFGPAVVIAAIWLCAGLWRYWPYAGEQEEQGLLFFLFYKAKPFLAVAVLVSVFAALRVLPTMDPNEARYLHRKPSPDVYRYISDIEREFENLPVEKVLLDIGNWIYLRHGYLARDRAVSIADQPLAGIYDNLDIIVDRIRNRVYDKILVRDYHTEFFLYDYGIWPRPSGVKETLRKYYHEIRIIPQVAGTPLIPPLIMNSGPVSVFVPRTGDMDETE